MSAGPNTKRRRVPFLPVVVLAMALAVGAWLLLRKGSAAPEPEGETEAAVVAPPVVPPPRPVRPVKAAPATPPPRPLEYAEDGKPFMPPGPNDPHPDTFAHPHPITPQHRRIFRENELLYQLNEAMDGKETPRLRKLLKDYRDEYPEDPHEMQEGYELIADCQEHPGDAKIHVAAQKYFNEEIASTLRRFVLRHCLEPKN